MLKKAEWTKVTWDGTELRLHADRIDGSKSRQFSSGTIAFFPKTHKLSIGSGRNRAVLDSPVAMDGMVEAGQQIEIVLYASETPYMVNGKACQRLATFKQRVATKKHPETVFVISGNTGIKRDSTSISKGWLMPIYLHHVGIATSEIPAWLEGVKTRVRKARQHMAYMFKEALRACTQSIPAVELGTFATHVVEVLDQFNMRQGKGRKFSYKNELSEKAKTDLSAVSLRMVASNLRHDKKHEHPVPEGLLEEIDKFLAQYPTDFTPLFRMINHWDECWRNDPDVRAGKYPLREMVFDDKEGWKQRPNKAPSLDGVRQMFSSLPERDVVFENIKCTLKQRITNDEKPWKGLPKLRYEEDEKSGNITLANRNKQGNSEATTIRSFLAGQEVLGLTLGPPVDPQDSGHEEAGKGRGKRWRNRQLRPLTFSGGKGLKPFTVGVLITSNLGEKAGSHYIKKWWLSFKERTGRISLSLSLELPAPAPVKGSTAGLDLRWSTRENLAQIGTLSLPAEGRTMAIFANMNPRPPMLAYAVAGVLGERPELRHSFLSAAEWSGMTGKWLASSGLPEGGTESASDFESKMDVLDAASSKMLNMRIVTEKETGVRLFSFDPEPFVAELGETRWGRRNREHGKKETDTFEYKKEMQAERDLCEDRLKEHLMEELGDDVPPWLKRSRSSGIKSLLKDDILMAAHPEARAAIVKWATEDAKAGELFNFISGRITGRREKEYEKVCTLIMQTLADNGYGKVVIKNMDVKGIGESREKSKKTEMFHEYRQRLALGDFTAILRNIGRNHGVEVAVTKAASLEVVQTCNSCGYFGAFGVTKNNRLECPNCHARFKKTENAAKNLAAATSA